jgi:aryl-alcohol dehydrogenase-like predicted oxidoreductase
VVAYGVLSRGLIGGSSGDFGSPGDYRSAISPRFQGPNLEKNLKLVDALGRIAREKGATAAQLAIAWVLARGEDIVPLVGTKTRSRLDESLGALDLELSAEDLARIEEALPVGSIAGDRYHAPFMAMVNR